MYYVPCLTVFLSVYVGYEIKKEVENMEKDKGW